MRRNLLLWIAMSLLASKALGDQPTPTGTIKEAEFIIEKEKTNRLPESARLFKKAPLPTHGADATVALPYELREIAPELDTLQRKIKVLRAKQDLLTRLYGNYVKGGYGNRHTPYLEGFFDNKRNAKHAYGLHFRHWSHGEDRYFEEFHNAARLHGKLFTEAWVLDGAMKYHQDKYPWAQDSLGASNALAKAPSFHQIYLQGTLANYLQNQFNYQVQGHFTHLRNSLAAHEHQGGLRGKIDYSINHDFALKAMTELYLTQHKDTAPNNRHLWRLKPTLHALFHDLKIQAGLNLVYQNDSSQVVNPLNVYPVITINYALRKWVRPYIEISGDIQRTSWQGFTAENPWLAPCAALRHTNQRFIFRGGAQGDITEKVAFHTGVSTSSYQQLYCFVNNPTAPQQFDIQYDPATTLLNVFGELTQTNKAATFTTRLRGDYFHYKLKQLPKPWHRPRYQLDLRSTYKLHDKMLCKGTLYWLGGIAARNPTTKAAQSLANIIDLGLGIDYWWSPRLTIFLDCQNLLNSMHTRYLHAPTRGFQLVLGLAYAW